MAATGGASDDADAGTSARATAASAREGDNGCTVPLDEDGDYFIEECYWGPFSRKIILPVEVDSSRADAAMKDGVLTVRIPKIQREKKKKLTIKE